MDKIVGILINGFVLIFSMLLIVRNASAAPAHFSLLGALQRQARNLKNGEPYWLNPCGVDMSAQAARSGYETSPSKDWDYYLLPIKSNAQTLDVLVENLKTKKEGGDPFLRNQIKQFRLAKFPSPPEISASASDSEVLNDVGASTPVASLLQTAYGLLQYDAAHLRSTESDERAYEGRHQDDLYEMQYGPNGLQTLMCAVRMAMKQAGVEPDQSIQQKTKDLQLGTIRDLSQRNLRDILRLDGIAAHLEYIVRVFDAKSHKLDE